MPLKELRTRAGLRNDVSPERFEEGDLSEALNVDLDGSGSVLTRLAATQVRAGATHSAWSDGSRAFFVAAGTLYELLPDLTVLARVVAVGDLPVAYASNGASVFWSNGAQTGAISDRARGWGLAVPLAIDLSAVPGDLAAGSYLVCTAFVRDDGLRSGASVVTRIDVGPSGGISMTLPESSDADVIAVEVFVSVANGEAQRLVGQGAPGAAFDYLAEVSDGPAAAMSLFVPPPPGAVLAYYRGRIYIGHGDMIYFTEPFAYHHVDPRSGFMPAVGRVTMLAAVDEGLFVGTDKECAFYSGRDPGEMQRLKRSSSAVLPGSLAYVPHESAFDGSVASSDVPFWMSSAGICAGMQDGSVRDVTSRRFTPPTAQRAAGGFKQRGGIPQYVANLFAS